MTSFPGSSPGDAGDGSVADGGKKEVAVSVTGSESFGRNREISPTRRPVEGKGLRPGRRGSLLGLDRATVDNEGEGLGDWKVCGGGCPGHVLPVALVPHDATFQGGLCSAVLAILTMCFWWEFSHLEKSFLGSATDSPPDSPASLKYASVLTLTARIFFAMPCVRPSNTIQAGFCGRR